MQFAEVAVQNVRGFSPAGRFALKAGYLVLKPPTAEVSPLSGLSLALLFADGRGGDASFMAPGAKSAKAALTFVGVDGVTYRILRELGGSGTLHRMNKATQQPELVSSDSSEISQFLRGQAGLPPRTTFEQVYCLQPGQLPSRRPRKAPAAAKQDPKTSGRYPSLASASTVLPAEDIPAAEAKLRALEQERVASSEVDQIQFNLDGLTSQLFEADQRLKSTDGLKVAISEAEAAWRAAPTPESLGLPRDIMARVQRFPKVVAKRDESLARLNADREAEAEVEAPYVEPLKENRAFWGGLGAGLLFLALGLGLGFGVDDAFRYLALLDIPAFGVAAFMALRHVDELQKASRQGSKDNRTEAREKKILDEFEAEAAPLRMAQKALGVEELDEIAPALERKELLGARVVELKDQLQAMEADPDYVAAISQREMLKEQIEALNAELAQKGSYVRDVREVEREITRVKESIALAKAPPPAAAPGADGTAAPVETLEDPSPVLLSQAADVFTTDILSVQGMLKDRCLQYLTALTDRRYQGLEWDKEGRAFALASGRRVPVGELPPKDLDLYYLALRMTVVEKASARVKRPFLLEDVFAGMEEVKLPLIARMLKHLGTLTQVLHVTAHPGFAQMADGTVNV
ncbi:chromosome segregation protein SMC [Pyxidicoccus fallax]|uniref:Chromosome segregation protein SMC n=1 Tax=Pyxidicoccus fallax TaxID=394095 RepID=A0A848LYB5_9BACT|nr:chromosome segregation protein SMC [Pyxidicoccus fallax]NMO22522.1 chromosome segregation protein SMC [Pyxidicoccus fallax]NPC86716.1 chromosome segregation protein SMC [Pyxidicoccus fallax]